MRSNIDNLILENKKLKKIIEKLETKLQKYTNPEINKKYYHKNKEEIKQRNYKIKPTS